MSTSIACWSMFFFLALVGRLAVFRGTCTMLAEGRLALKLLGISEAAFLWPAVGSTVLRPAWIVEEEAFFGATKCSPVC